MHDVSPADDDAVAQLLRLTGPPVPIPAAREARVRAATEDAWRQAVAQRSARRSLRWGLPLAASILLAIAASLWLGRSPIVVPQIVAQSAAVDGYVRWVADGEAPRALEIGRELAPGDRLDTGTGRAALTLAGGAAARLDAATRVRLVAADVIELERGGVYFDVGGGAQVEVRTPLGTARDVGTRFEVRVDDERLRVRVREGLVELENGAKRHRAEGGTELAVDPGGRLTRDDIATYGAAWDWTFSAAPAFALDGATLADFLDWLGHESGWDVRYITPASVEQAAEVELFGPPLSGLEPRAALELVMSITGWRYRLDGAVLEVGLS